MDQKHFLKQTALCHGLSLQTVEEVLQAMTEVLCDTPAQGQTVGLSPDFGKLLPQPREQKLNPNSPRTPKKPHDYICFRPGKRLEKKLRAEAPQSRGDGE